MGDGTEYQRRYRKEHQKKSINLDLKVWQWVKGLGVKRNCSCNDIIEELIRFRIAKAKEEKEKENGNT